MPAWLQLHDFAHLAHAAFGGRVLLVGSALRRKRPRDVDVRVELLDSEYVAKIGPIGECNTPATAWSGHCLAWSALGREMTRRPIDFQIQPLCVAYWKKDEPRIVLAGSLPDEVDGGES